MVNILGDYLADSPLILRRNKGIDDVGIFPVNILELCF